MRRASLAILSLMLAGACTKLNPAFGDESGPGTTDASTTVTMTTTEASTTDLPSGTGTLTVATTGVGTTSAASSTSEALTSGTTDATDATTTTGDTSTTTTTATTGEASTGDGEPPATCAEARDRGGVDSGVYTLAVPQQVGATTEVWCEQQVADGGWLLVARSVATDMPPAFGWGSVAGDILDDSAPYSLSLLAYKFPASELLIGSYSEGKQLGGHAFKVAAPPDFPFPYDMAAGQTSAPQHVLGDCDPGGGPSMLQWIGYTTLPDRFRMRDEQESDVGDIYGLFATGFYLGGDNCSDAGKLDGSQGMIFAR